MSAADNGGPIVPTYYVRSPDGSISIAEPQPSIEQIAAQRTTYGQCDYKHGGGVCEDPDCYLASSVRRLNFAAPELLAAGTALYAAIGDYKRPDQGFLTPELIAAGVAWCAAVAKATGGAS